MTMPADDREDLIKDLFTEAHGLRMKNEQISQYVETRIAELVKTRRELLQIRGGLEKLVEQRNKLQGQLDAVATENGQLIEMHAVMTDQRDRLRIRIVTLEELVEKGTELQGKLDAVTTENGQLIEMHAVMTDQRDRLQKHSVALEELVEKGTELQGQLDAVTTENGQLIEMRALVTGQRDHFQKRIEAVEASRSYRIGQRLSQIAAKLLQQK